MAKSGKILGTVFKVLVFIVFVIIALLCMAMAYIMFAPDDMPKPFALVYSTPVTNFILPERAPEPTPTIEPTPVTVPGNGVMVNMSTKIINLADTSGRRYIRLTIVLEFAPDYSTEAEPQKEGEATDPNAALTEEINTRMPLMDDVVITLLSTKTYESLYTADGKELLRREIMDAINARLPEFHVISVYFTEFVVQ